LLIGLSHLHRIGHRHRDRRAGGYHGGWVDECLMRVTRPSRPCPTSCCCSVVVAVFGSDICTVTIAIGAVSWPAPARLTRAEFLLAANREFVQACRTLGMGNAGSSSARILPTRLPPVIVYASVVMAVAILLESALAFLRCRTQCRLLGQPHRVGPGRAARAVVRLRHSRRRDPLTVLRGVAGGAGAERRAEPRLRGDERGPSSA
jgi:peptide/nickel transport system permease protein